MSPVAVRLRLDGAEKAGVANWLVYWPGVTPYLIVSDCLCPGDGAEKFGWVVKAPNCLTIRHSLK